MNLKRKFFQIFRYELCPDILIGGDRKAFAVSVDKPQTVQPLGFLRGYANFFIGKLPTVRHISLCADVGFIAVKQIYVSLLTELFQTFDLFQFIIVNLRQRFSLGTKPYPLISSAKLFKKRRSVLPLIRLPLKASHSALAVCRRWRLRFTASKTEEVSVSASKGLRPCPGLLRSPSMPSCLNRLTQLFTLTALIPVIEPVSLEERPSDFSSITWQRLRKQWLSPCLNPVSKACRELLFNSGVLTRPIMSTKLILLRIM